jgi:Type VI secretion system/phage-baseplate injector OB domain
MEFRLLNRQRPPFEGYIGKPLEFIAFGDDWSETAIFEGFVFKVAHYYDLTYGYRNEFSATPWKDYTSAKQPAPQRISGAVSARVVAHNDPRSMGRVQIQYDWMEGRATAWARMVTPQAGGRRGFMFMRGAPMLN